MADYRAISTGNYSDLARWEVWNGSAWVAATQLPTVADDVYANSYTVTIDVDSFASSYRASSLALGISVGGFFLILGGITVVGDVIGTTGLNTFAVMRFDNTATLNSYIIGDLFGGPAFRNRAVHTTNTNGAILYVTGNLTGALGGDANTRGNGSDALLVNSTSLAIVYGNIVAGPAGTALSNMGVVGNVLVFGRAIGTSSRTAAWGVIIDEIEGRNESCIVTSKFIMPSTNQTSWINCKAKAGAPVQIEIYDESDNAITLNPIAAQGHASQSDVRLGTSYANGALTGTLAVPPAGSVSLGVPVDATTGTGSVSSSEIRDLILPSILSAITQP